MYFLHKMNMYFLNKNKRCFFNFKIKIKNGLLLNERSECPALKLVFFPLRFQLHSVVLLSCFNRYRN